MRELAGVAQLKEKRGREEVTFSDVADHLTDFATKHPDDADVMDRLGRFLATVEDVAHDHDAVSAGSTEAGSK